MPEETGGHAMAERRTESGIPLEAVYTPERHGSADYAERLGDPGAYPYTRGEMTGVLRMAYGQPYDPLGMIEAPI
jgi:hypothetical protein